MKDFLEAVAADVLHKYGNNLSRVAIVFPNKRAALFMNEYLARLSDKPVWGAAYLTISDMFYRHSSLVPGDPIKLICDLHQTFTACTQTDETLDHFFGWGQLLLADFDDIDKNMADARKVFDNVENLHELDDVSYLSETQKEVIKKFFATFTDDHDSELKKRFLTLWSRFYDIYTQFKARLETQGIAYEGAVYRQVIEQEHIEFEYDTYLFVGFNALHKVEQRLFERLQRAGKAKFYWDFDRYYMEDSHNEAGLSIRRYLSAFPNEFDNRDAALYNRLRQKKDVTFMSATTGNAQARYISAWLRAENRIAAGKRTVIVLADEALLPTVLHCLPTEVEKVNITMGYPLQQSQAASLVQALLALQVSGRMSAERRFKLHYVRAVLNHPYLRYLSSATQQLNERLQAHGNYFPEAAQLAIDEGLAEVFTPLDDMRETHYASLLLWMLNLLKHIGRNARHEADPLLQESVFKLYTLLNRLCNLIQTGDLTIDITTLQQLIAQLVRSTTIAFHGEPIEGIQIMGVLETRNLDFDHILMLSCNEGKIPASVNDASFIPYSIRKAFELTTIDNKTAIFSYYFHRLLQRAQDATLLYNIGTENGRSSEMSRFMLQLMVESGLPIARKALQTGQTLLPSGQQAVHKDAEIMAILNGFEHLSPTAINRYMTCPLRFYYEIVLGLKEPLQEEEGSMDVRTFGDVFHRSAELIYRRIMTPDGRVAKESIEQLLAHNEVIELCVDEAFHALVFKADRSHYTPQYNGVQLINRAVILRYLTRILHMDAKLAPFVMRGLEQRVLATVHFETSVGACSIMLKGFIDRLDEVMLADGERRLRVIDYKTGRSPQQKVKDIEEVFSGEQIREKHTDYYLQTLLYASIVRKDATLNPHELPVSPALLFIQNSTGNDYDPTLTFGREPIKDILPFQEDFTARLQGVLSNIFDPSIPFSPTVDTDKCTFCPYRKLCMG